jgi:hypothetical protein
MLWTFRITTIYQTPLLYFNDRQLLAMVINLKKTHFFLFNYK